MMRMEPLYAHRLAVGKTWKRPTQAGALPPASGYQTDQILVRRSSFPSNGG